MCTGFPSLMCWYFLFLGGGGLLLMFLVYKVWKIKDDSYQRQLDSLERQRDILKKKD